MIKHLGLGVIVIVIALIFFEGALVQSQCTFSVPEGTYVIYKVYPTIYNGSKTINVTRGTVYYNVTISTPSYIAVVTNNNASSIIYGNYNQETINQGNYGNLTVFPALNPYILQPSNIGLGTSTGTSLIYKGLRLFNYMNKTITAYEYLYSYNGISLDMIVDRATGLILKEILLARISSVSINITYVLISTNLSGLGGNQPTCTIQANNSFNIAFLAIPLIAIVIILYLLFKTKKK